MRSIDLNCDLGEAAGPPEDAAAIMPAITSANIACGFHAGDPSLMARTVRLAKGAGVACGAHPGFPDREGFGRRERSAAPDDVEAMVLYQLGALAAIAARDGVRLRHVKPHGALYTMAAREVTIAAAIARAVRAADPSLALIGPPGSAILRAAAEAGLPSAAEGFADRSYEPDGALTMRSRPGAVIHDAALVAGRAVGMARDGIVLAADGRTIALRVDTICLHGDTPGAAALAWAVRRALEGAGLAVRPLGPDSGRRDSGSGHHSGQDRAPTGQDRPPSG